MFLGFSPQSQCLSCSAVSSNPLFAECSSLGVKLCLLWCRPQGNPLSGVFKFHVVITTFEMILADCPELKKIHWSCVIIDEAHRLKNRNCKLLEGLKLMALVSLAGFLREEFPSVDGGGGILQAAYLCIVCLL